jgi:hypothetical protein
MSWLSTVNDAAKTGTTDGSIADTQSAVDYVAAKAQAGWVITIGAAGGSYTWATSLTVDFAFPTTIQGASPSNRPSITCTVTASGCIYLALYDGVLLTIRDIIFPQFPNADNCIFGSGAGVDTYRFVNLLFNHTRAFPAVRIGSAGGGGGAITNGAAGPYGVISGCTVDGSADRMGAGFYFHEYSQNWQRPMTWGTKYAHYVEDCIFTSPTPAIYPAVDGWAGCRVVFRRNTLTRVYFGTHGADTSGVLNSACQHEVMHNVFTNPTQMLMDTMVLIKGGSAVIFDNDFTIPDQGWQNACIKFAYLRGDGTGLPTTAWDRTYIDGTGTGGDEYLGTMQPGSGYTGTPGSDPNFPLEPWGSVPMYLWDNVLLAGTPAISQIVGDGGGFIALGRDYFNNTQKPGYTEYTYPHPLLSSEPEPEPESNGGATSGRGRTSGPSISLEKIAAEMEAVRQSRLQVDEEEVMSVLTSALSILWRQR